ncbi:MAG: hypothetical protein U1E17_00050 [Geminicoccaceae bacterium]
MEGIDMKTEDFQAHDAAVDALVSAIAGLVERRGFPAEAAVEAVLKAAWLLLTGPMGCPPREAARLTLQLVEVLEAAAEASGARPRLAS